MDENTITLYNNDTPFISPDHNNMLTASSTQLQSLVTHFGTFVLGISTAVLYNKLQLYYQQSILQSFQNQNQQIKDVEFARYLKQKRWLKLKRQIYYTLGIVGGITTYYYYNKYKTNTINRINNIFTTSSTTAATTGNNHYKAVPA